MFDLAMTLLTKMTNIKLYTEKWKKVLSKKIGLM